MFGLTTRNNNQGLRTYNPFREMEEFEKAFFSNPFGSFWGNAGLEEFKTDVTDEGDHYLLEADLPGFEKKDITLDIRGTPLPFMQNGTPELRRKIRRTKSFVWSVPTAPTPEASMFPVWIPITSMRSTITVFFA